MPPSIAYILPSYSHFEYARRCLLSLHKYTPGAIAVVVDDASPGWNDKWTKNTGGDVHLYRFSAPGGLTRSWNAGFQTAKRTGATHIIAGNNDVLFHDGWWQGMCAALDSGWDLVGPLSNAPGVTAGDDKQHIRTYMPDYTVTDKAAYTDAVSRLVWKAYGNRVLASAINGFFMMAKTKTWLDNSYSPELVFPPSIDVMPSGRQNKTPKMTGQEDWLCSVWTKRGLKTGISLGSFIWHYRSVSRGIKYAKGDWARIAT